VNVLLSADEIRQGVDRLAQQINRDYAGKHLVLIGVLTGSLILLADLIRQLNMPLRVELVQARSYRGAATTAGQLTLQLEGLPELSGEEILLIDDIYDTGQTLAALVEELQRRASRAVRSAVLLRKLGRQEASIEPDYVAFEIPDKFVVGYGMDHADRYRNLPYIAVLDESDLKEPSA
jgi:hypoxanthine phosphoribosyltransferase